MWSDFFSFVCSSCCFVLSCFVSGADSIKCTNVSKIHFHHFFIFFLRTHLYFTNHSFRCVFSCFLLQAVKEFIEILNKKIERKTISPSTALKFVLARKLDVQRAVELFEQHELIRKVEDLDNINPMSDPLRTELETGKFTILVSCNLTDCLFKMRKRPKNCR